MLTIELTPIEADKIVEYIDSEIRKGGLESALEFVSLAQKIKTARFGSMDEANAIGRAHMSSQNDDGVIDATSDFEDDNRFGSEQEDAA